MLFLIPEVKLEFKNYTLNFIIFIEQEDLSNKIIGLYSGQRFYQYKVDDCLIIMLWSLTILFQITSVFCKQREIFLEWYFQSQSVCSKMPFRAKKLIVDIFSQNWKYVFTKFVLNMFLQKLHLIHFYLKSEQF